MGFVNALCASGSPMISFGESARARLVSGISAFLSVLSLRGASVSMVSCKGPLPPPCPQILFKHPHSSSTSPAGSCARRFSEPRVIYVYSIIWMRSQSRRVRLPRRSESPNPRVLHFCVQPLISGSARCATTDSLRTQSRNICARRIRCICKRSQTRTSIVRCGTV